MIFLDDEGLIVVIIIAEDNFGVILLIKQGEKAIKKESKVANHSNGAFVSVGGVLADDEKVSDSYFKKMIKIEKVED